MGFGHVQAIYRWYNMYMIKISDVKNRFKGKLHGSSVNKVSDFYGACQEAAANLISEVDLVELRRIADITELVKTGTYDYTAPTDLYKDRILDIRLKTDRTVSDATNNTTAYQFDRNKDYNDFTIEYDSGVKTLRLSKAVSVTTGSTYEIVYQSNSLFKLDTDGTWVDKPTVDDDTLNIDIDAYPMFLYELAHIIHQELQGQGASVDVGYFNRKGKEAYDRYKRRNKSEVRPKRKSYYSM